MVDPDCPEARGSRHAVSEANVLLIEGYPDILDPDPNIFYWYNAKLLKPAPLSRAGFAIASTCYTGATVTDRYKIKRKACKKKSAVWCGRLVAAKNKDAAFYTGHMNPAIAPLFKEYLMEPINQDNDQGGMPGFHTL